MALSLLASRSLAHLAYSVAPRACCSALPHARAMFVEARSRRYSKRTESSHQPRLQSGVATQAVHAFAGSVSLAADRVGRCWQDPSVWQETHMVCINADVRNGRCSSNPRRASAMPFEDSAMHFRNALRTCLHTLGLDSPQLGPMDARYPGCHPELVDFARQRGGTATPDKIRAFLKQNPHILDRITPEQLDKAGITREQLMSGDFHIDHIWPSAKKGLDHPCNYFIMSKRDNTSFRAEISAAKCRHVGVGVTLLVLAFHLEVVLQGMHQEPQRPALFA